MFHYQEEVYLPWSNQRYSINVYGEVKEGETLLEKVVVDGCYFLELDWYDGRRLYRYDQIPIVSYFNIKLPQKHLDQIELIFKDNNSSNTSIDNLAYRFKNGPVECEQFPGHFYVPYYTDFVISRSGSTISLLLLRHRGTRDPKKWTVSKPVLHKNIKGGYYCGRGRRDHDRVDGVSRHRLMALTFIPYQSDPLQLVVNHRNGIPGDDRLENLEWVTYSENTKHAYRNNLHPNKVVRIVVLNDLTGIEKRYSTIADCAKELGVSYGFLTARMSKPHVRYRDGIRVKLDDGSEWASTTVMRSPTLTRAVIAKDVFTKIVTVYENVARAAEKTGILHGTVAYHCRRKPLTPTKGLSFRYVDDDDGSWPETSEYHLRMYRRFPEGLIPSGLFLLDSENNIQAFYECFADFSKETGLNEGCIYRMLRGNLPWNGYRLQKFDVKGTL